MKRNSFTTKRQSGKPPTLSLGGKQKVFQAEAEVVAINERDLPKRLGLLLRNGQGQERWFSWWSNGRHGKFPALSAGDRVQLSYCEKPPKKKGGEPFLNILELELLPQEEGEGEAEEEGKSVNDRVHEVMAEEIARQVNIRASVALKAAAASGWAKDADDLFALAGACYDWLKAMEEREVERILGEEVNEEQEEPGF